MCVPKDSIHVREMSALMFLHLLDTIYYIRREPLWSFGRDAEKSKNLRGQAVIEGHLMEQALPLNLLKYGWLMPILPICFRRLCLVLVNEGEPLAQSSLDLLLHRLGL